MKTATRPRLLVLVGHRGNARRLREWAVDALQADVVSEADDEIDAVVADVAAFARVAGELEELRARLQPVFVPVLLVCSTREVERMTPHMWSSADDVVITPIRPAELRLRLERLLDRRSRTLAAEAERTELRRSNVDLERFAFVAAHELVAPLAIVNGAVQTVSARFVAGDEAARKIVDAAVEGCQRMQGLIEDILDLSRAGQAGALEPVDTALLVGDVCDELRQRLASSTATVEHHGLPVVMGSPAQLRLVFRNLISNSVKFARPGVEPRIRVDASREGGEWTFCVSDNGMGIPAGDRDRVFGLFARADGGAAVPGTGIGLAICRRIVERLGGRIWIDDADGDGTRFCFTVPGAEPGDAA